MGKFGVPDSDPVKAYTTKEYNLLASNPGEGLIKVRSRGLFENGHTLTARFVLADFFTVCRQLLVTTG